VARNRKRAKERRARRPQPVSSRRAGARADDGVPSRAQPADPESSGRDEQLPQEPERTEEEVVPGPTAAHTDELAPDPLEHAAPDVELADAQVAFGDVADPEFQHEEELVEEELEEQADEQRDRALPVAQGERRPNLFSRLSGFLQGSWRELQRVQWPDRRQVAQATGVVLGFVIVAGIFLGLSDLVAQKVVNFILK
jgi:preprotein translocase SecE subunit